MGRLTPEVFPESCCDGGACSNDLSAQPCGCDPGLKRDGKIVGHVCDRHTEEGRLASREAAGYDKQCYTGAGEKPPTQNYHAQATHGLSGGITNEFRVVDPNTGGEKGSKLARFSLIPRDFLWVLAEHYGRGARKYDDRNWERGYRWSLSVDALDRHLSQWLLGENDDPETGSSHLVAVAWHAIALWWWHKRGLGTNDVRPQ